MQSRTPLTLQSAETRLGSWLEKQAAASLAPQADAAPVRRDMAALLSYVRDNKVVGTQSTGNLPLKAVREITARFVVPPELDFTIGDYVYHVRSEMDLWPLYFLHILAEVGGLARPGRARLWRVTAQGRRFLEAPPLLQAPFLLAVWWHKVNWLVAYPYAGMGDDLPYQFPRAALGDLRRLPVGTAISFKPFADGLIAKTGLRWTAPDSIFATEALRGSVERMVIDVLADFGAVKCRYRKERLGKGTIPRLAGFRITPWGQALLGAVALLGR